MDKKLVEKVTRLVIEVLNDMNQPTSTLNNRTVKIWSHTSPLPEPIQLTTTKDEQPTTMNMKAMVTITPYMKEK